MQTSIQQVTDPHAERPKRPRTAYNYFFHNERLKLLDSLPERKQGKPKKGHGKISFADMAKVISLKWKAIGTEEMIYFANLANEDKFRYRNQMQEYKKAQRDKEEEANHADTEPIPYYPVSWDSLANYSSISNPGPSIADLAEQLDKESIDLFIAAFK